MRFEWDDEKAVSNLEKHDVSFGEATEVLYDPNALEGYDNSQSVNEDRFFIIGLSSRRLLFVVYAERIIDVVRIIFAEQARKRRKIMNKQQIEEEFVFAVISDDGENVTIEVSEEDYQRERAAGVDDESLLKPGRYKLKRGGFMARHSKMKPWQQKRA